jgi:transposase-like protein
MNRRQLSVRAVSRKAGVTDKAMRNWRAGHSARLADLEACLNALGLEICTKPAEET